MKAQPKNLVHGASEIQPDSSSAEIASQADAHDRLSQGKRKLQQQQQIISAHGTPADAAEIHSENWSEKQKDTTGTDSDQEPPSCKMAAAPAAEQCAECDDCKVRADARGSSTTTIITMTTTTINTDVAKPAPAGSQPPPPSHDPDDVAHARARRTDAILALKEGALESLERQLRAHRRGAGPIVLHMDGRSRHARRKHGDG